MEDTYTWVYSIIESCNNDFHFNCADVLISLFDSKYGDDEKVEELELLRLNKWNAVHTILV